MTVTLPSAPPLSLSFYTLSANNKVSATYVLSLIYEIALLLGKSNYIYQHFTLSNNFSTNSEKI